MSRRWSFGWLAAGLVLAAGCDSGSGRTSETEHRPDRDPRELRVCADPNNLPFSNERGEGFENRLAELVAREMGATVRYTWWAQRRGFVRNTLRAGTCDVIMGVPSSYELVRPTRPYYRSTYVFVYAKDRPLDLRSLDDAVLRTARVGVHIIGDDYANAPPAHALSNRGIVSNVVGYSIYGDYAQPNPPARLVEAVAARDVDVAIVWGPLAGYFAKRSAVPLEIVPVSPAIDLPFLPFVFDIAMGVRREDEALQQELDAILERRADDIRALLEEYGVPVVGGRRATARNEE
jgi:mxaJ protein